VSIKTIDENTNSTTKWILNGDQSKSWFPAKLPIISATADFFIRIEGLIFV